MQIGMVGLGRMGGNMVLRLIRGGHDCVVFDVDRAVVQRFEKHSASVTASLKELISSLRKPRAVWIMVPAGKPTEEVIEKLSLLMEPGDTIIEGGNSYYKDDFNRAEKLRKEGVRFLDVGVSGGIWGLEKGYCIMIGGDETDVQRLSPIFRTLAESPDRGWGRVGPTGAGHYVKMVHNGMIYGILQAYAEGFELLDNKREFGLNLGEIADMWRYSSVARSWLLDLISSSLGEDPELNDIAARISDSGEGRWTVIEAIEQNCSIPIISMSLLRRFRSREDAPFSDKLIAKLRNLFGGHELPKEP
jgi:6-phosphogluconate dehydrogenase